VAGLVALEPTPERRVLSAALVVPTPHSTLIMAAAVVAAAAAVAGMLLWLMAGLEGSTEAVVAAENA
jgi:hypothetical protein